MVLPSPTVLTGFGGRVPWPVNFPFMLMIWSSWMPDVAEIVIWLVQMHLGWRVWRYDLFQKLSKLPQRAIRTKLEPFSNCCTKQLVSQFDSHLVWQSDTLCDCVCCNIYNFYNNLPSMSENLVSRDSFDVVPWSLFALNVFLQSLHFFSLSLFVKFTHETDQIKLNYSESCAVLAIVYKSFE